VIDLVENQVVRIDFSSIFVYLIYLEVCISNSFIRSVLQKAEIKFEEKRKRAEQSDDSLEEENEEIIDSLSDDDNNDDDDDLQGLFNPIPQKQQM
jgi:hypothetical protein